MSGIGLQGQVMGASSLI